MTPTSPQTPFSKDWSPHREQGRSSVRSTQALRRAEGERLGGNSAPPPQARASEPRTTIEGGSIPPKLVRLHHSRGAYHRCVEIESGSARHADRATQADRRAARSRSRLKDKDHMTTTAGPRLTSEQSTELFKPLCAITPEYFQAVGQFYEDFSQTTDEEVRELVARAAQRS